jgi:hypothetical protein
MSKEKILIDSGLLESDHIKEIKNKCSIDVFVFLNDLRKDYALRNDEILKSNNIVFYSELLDFESSKTIDKAEIDIIEAISAMPTAIALAQRLQLGGLIPGYFNDYLALKVLILNAIKVINKNKFTKLIWTNTPHDWTWYLAEVGRKLSIPVYHTRVVNPFGVVQIVCNFRDVVTIKKTRTVKTSEVENIFQKYRGSYSDAMPIYERNNIKKYGLNRSLMVRFNAIFRNKSLFRMVVAGISEIKQIEYRNCYNKSCSEISVNYDFGIFFLHYQPERTTIPDGGDYFDQLSAIERICSELKENEILYVREHPSTFRLDFDLRYRSINFIKRLKALNKVKLLAVEGDVFDLVDKCKFVATVTGNVGFEALVRGVKTITFGNTFYDEFCGNLIIGKESKYGAIRHHLDKKMNFELETGEAIKDVLENSFEYNERIAGSVDAIIQIVNLS